MLSWMDLYVCKLCNTEYLLKNYIFISNFSLWLLKFSLFFSLILPILLLLSMLIFLRWRWRSWASRIRPWVIWVTWWIWARTTRSWTFSLLLLFNIFTSIFIAWFALIILPLHYYFYNSFSNVSKNYYYNYKF